MSDNFDKIEESIREIESGWWTNEGGIRYHHKSDPRHAPDGFGDSIHHTCFFLYALLKLNLLFTREEQQFRDFYFARLRNGIFDRDYKGEDSANRDQLTPAIPVISNLLGTGFATKALSLVRKVKWWEFIQPHHIVFFRRARNKSTIYPLRFIGDLFELVDSWFDVIKLKKMTKKYQKEKTYSLEWHTNGVDSSIIKTVLRNITATDYQPTFLAKINNKYIARRLDPKSSFTRYFSFSHQPDLDNPPPIYKVWIPLLEERFHEE